MQDPSFKSVQFSPALLAEGRDSNKTRTLIFAARKKIERAQMPTRTFIDMPKSGVFAPRPFERRKTQTKTQKFKDKFVEVLTMGLRGHAEPDNPDFLKSEEDLSPELKSLPPKKNTFGRKISMEEYQEKLKEVERKPLEDRAKIKREANTPAMKKLISMIDDYEEEPRFKKAARHLEDAIYLRPIRHDIDSSSICCV